VIHGKSKEHCDKHRDIADVSAGDVIVYGTVKGNSGGKGKIEIKKDGSVSGDLTTPQIIIEDGAYFKGSIEIEKSAEEEGDKNVFSRTASHRVRRRDVFDGTPTTIRLHFEIFQNVSGTSHMSFFHDARLEDRRDSMANPVQSTQGDVWKVNSVTLFLDLALVSGTGCLFRSAENLAVGLLRA